MIKSFMKIQCVSISVSIKVPNNKNNKNQTVLSPRVLPQPVGHISRTGSPLEPPNHCKAWSRWPPWPVFSMKKEPEYKGKGCSVNLASQEKPAFVTTWILLRRLTTSWTPNEHALNCYTKNNKGKKKESIPNYYQLGFQGEAQKSNESEKHTWLMTQKAQSYPSSATFAFTASARCHGGRSVID